MPLNVSPDNTGFNRRGDGPFSQPFQEQVDFFRQKLNLPTEHYDDILKSAHDRAFVVAGATKADLLNDLRTAVDRAIAEGKSYGWFRKEFDAIVAHHGWEGWTGSDTKAGRDWRARVIYNTNMRASYAAGRYAQMKDPDVLKTRPYWKYVHNDTVVTPRPLHKAWGDKPVVLRHDDPWWVKHKPPNGIGCRCEVIPVRAKEYNGAPAPDDGTYEKIDRYGVSHTLPKGVDYGWDYAPGANVAKPFKDIVEQKLIRFPAPIGADMMAALKPVMQHELESSFAAWVDAILASGMSKKSTQLMGWISADVLKNLAKAGKTPATAEIYTEDRLVVGRKADRHDKSGDALSVDEWKAMPAAFADDPKVLLDTDTGKLIYVLPSTDSRDIKVVVELDFVQGRNKTRLNLARAAFKMNANALLDRRRYKEMN